MIHIVKDRPIIVDRKYIGFCGIRGYSSNTNRKRAIKQMIRHGTAQRFVCFKDVNSEFAVSYMPSYVLTVLYMPN